MARNLDANVRPRARSAFDLESSAQVDDAFTHRMQTQMTWKRGRCIKANSVVMHLQQDSFGSLVQAQLDIPGAGVFDGVVHGLLHDAVEILFDQQGQTGLVA